MQGPCVSIDTACSSSLVTTHFAVRAIRWEGCSAGLSAGVNLPMNWETSVMFVGAAMTSGDGRCKTLNAAADGYVRSEACVAIKLRRDHTSPRIPGNPAHVRYSMVPHQQQRSKGMPAPPHQDLSAGLKQLCTHGLSSTAVLDACRLLASEAAGSIAGLILGTAVNQDGRSSSLTAPNGPSQQQVSTACIAGSREQMMPMGCVSAIVSVQVIRQAIRDANLLAADVGSVEMHGTGTALGDPIEIGALVAVFDRPGEGTACCLETDCPSYTGKHKLKPNTSARVDPSQVMNSIKSSASDSLSFTREHNSCPWAQKLAICCLAPVYSPHPCT